MKKILLLFLFFMASVFSVSAQLKLQDAFPSLTFTQPIEIVSAGDSTKRIFIASQNGIIRVVPNSIKAATASVFLNITGKVLSAGEQGLLGLAFHPDYKNNGYFYVNYTRPSPGVASETVISRFTVSPANPEQADPQSELILLTFSQPFSNHNGGKIAFGPDGYLYIATGDGGGGGDPQNNAQNLTNLLGKILRIDVDNTAPGLNYAIPADNPYVNNTQNFRQEIYAHGLRNPWKFSFDAVTSRLWAGDVGQNSREEIDIIEKGGNYGWRVMEGMVCYPPPATCNTTGLNLPVLEYTHASGAGKSVTGGFVYRGSIPALQGKYIYGDFVTGNIWALTYNTDATVNNVLLFSGAGSVAAFGEDDAKELFVCNYSTGKIFKIVDPFIATPDVFAATVVSAKQIDLSWQDHAYNETNYVIERAGIAEGPYQILDTLNANTIAYSDTNVTGGTTYFYRVKAINTSTNLSSVYTPTVSVTTPKIDQTITFNALPSTLADQEPFRLNATASSGLPVIFTIISGPAIISDTSLIAITDTGTVVVRASQEGNSNYNPAQPVEQSFKIGTSDDLSYVTSPADSAINVALAPEITSKEISGATQYIIELNTAADFSGTALMDTSTTTTTSFSELTVNTTYYTRVKTNALPDLWGPATSFTTTDQVTAITDEYLSEFWLKTYPNPAGQFVYLGFNLLSPSLVSVQLYTLQGIYAGTLVPEQLFSQGEQQLTCDTRLLSAGIYMYQLKINSRIKTGRIYIKGR